MLVCNVIFIHLDTNLLISKIRYLDMNLSISVSNIYVNGKELNCFIDYSFGACRYKFVYRYQISLSMIERVGI